MIDDVLFSTQGAWGVITLNRPKALNSITLDVCERIDAALVEWESDSRIEAVLIEGDGDRAFCAGGDIRSLYEVAKADPIEAAKFFRSEYRMNVRMHRFPKPYIALLDGITMGGGAGISMSASHRIATDRTLWAMPECMIGLTPDVGASYMLPRLAGGLGNYLGLTGARLKGYDAVVAGIATHYVPSDMIASLRETLLSLPLFANPETEITNAIGAFHTDHESSLKGLLSEIDYFFTDYGTPSKLLRALENVNTPFAEAALGAITPASPTCLELTHRSLTADPLNFEQCISREFCVVAHLMAHPDFTEGVRAQIIDKDRKPRWTPGKLADVNDADIDLFFSQPDGGALDLTGI